jgi:hypothetical protein
MRVAKRQFNIATSWNEVLADWTSFFYKRNDHRLMAAMRSSIRSRSTSQNLNDDSRSLSISSARADPLLSIGSGCGVPKRLLNFRGLRLNFNVRHLARFGFSASINHSPSNPLLLIVRNKMW